MKFEEVYDGEFAFVWRTLRRLGVPESDVADAAQEVFLVVHRRLAEFEGRARLTTWLFRICYNVARDRGRRAYQRHELSETAFLEEAIHPGRAPDAALQESRDLQVLESALAALNLQQRAVFTSFELEEMSCEQIAEALDLPLGTVYSRLRLARAAFARAAQRELARRRGPIRALGGRS